MENLAIKKASKEDINILFDLIYGLSCYEKRPQDMTGTKEELSYWLFDKKIATALILEKNKKPIGYAIYYPVFGSFSTKGKVHLEDIFIYEEYRGRGIGKYFFAKTTEFILTDGYSGMEWSCLDWNEPAIQFYNKLGAEQEKGRIYFDFNKIKMEEISNFIKNSK